MINRRQAMQSMGASLGLLALRGYEAQAAAAAHFTHGVASGDPLADRVILWSRVLPGDGQPTSLTATWQVAQDAAFAQVVSAGEVVTSLAQDYTLKVDATGLAPDSRYFYRFTVAGIDSPIGRTRTLPTGSVDLFRIGLASCSNYPQGYFNAYRDMAEADLDLELHLGDYIYEYAAGGYDNPEVVQRLGRRVVPANEILSLEDYRMRYGLYRTDSDLQAVHARHPFICVWDDHEISNDAWSNGAENHGPDEGDFKQRMRVARQAYHEWMPIRTAAGGDQDPIYRQFQIGNLADLIMLDTRIHGRDRGLDYQQDMLPKMQAFDIRDAANPRPIDAASARDLNADEVERLPLPFDLSGETPKPVIDYAMLKQLDPAALPNGLHLLPDGAAFKKMRLNDPARSILGIDQEQWLTEALQASQRRGSTWQILGQQVLMGKINIPALDPAELDLESLPASTASLTRMMLLLRAEGLPSNLDAWDGYPACRDRVMQALQTYAANPVVVAGDTHNAWANNLQDAALRPVGVEIGAPGITSPGIETYPVPAEIMQKAYKRASPEIADLDLKHRGWAEVTLTPTEITNQWHFVDTVLDKNYTVTHSAKHVCKAGAKQFT